MNIVATTQQSRFHTETLETFCEDVDLKDLTLTAGDKELLSDTQLRLFSGRHYGLVGANGTGKSTLLKAMGQGLVVGFPKNLHTLYVEQLEGTDAALSVLNTVMQADKEVLSWRQKASLLQDALQAEETEKIVRALKEVKLADLRAEVAEAALTNELRSGERGKTAQNRLLSLEASLAAGEEELSRSASAKESHAAPGLAQDMLQTLLDNLSNAGADAAEGRARKILLGLGFSSRQMDSPVSRLSGGWRMRAALAQALFTEPDILLLDEPTNHLDLPSILWLQGYLKTLEDRTIVVVSHDRVFLDEVAQEIILLRHNRLAYHAGNYSEYERNAEEKQQHMLRLQDGLNKKKAHIEKSIQEMGKGAKGHIIASWLEQEGLNHARKTGDDKKLHMVASRRKKLDDRMGLEKNAKGHRLHVNRDLAGYNFTSRQDAELDTPDLVPPWKLPEPVPLRTRGPLIQLESVSFAYPEAARDILRDVTTCIEQGERVGLVGANGQGKSTLVKLMLGELRPKSGTALQHPQARVGVFAQSNVEDLVQGKGQLTALKHMKALFPEAKEQDLRGHLGSFGLKGALAMTKMSQLSGGQAVRVGIAAVAYAEPHLLVLDEPTSHLDMKSIECLQTCLQGYSGGLVLVTHDQHFCNSVAQKVYLVEKQSLKFLEHGVKDYVRQLKKQKGLGGSS